MYAFMTSQRINIRCSKEKKLGPKNPPISGVMRAEITKGIEGPVGI